MARGASRAGAATPENSAARRGAHARRRVVERAQGVRQQGLEPRLVVEALDDDNLAEGVDADLLKRLVEGRRDK